MKKGINFFCLSATCFLVSCGQNSKDTTSNLAVIEIVQNLGTYQPVPVSRFVSELEYIPLETSDNCLITLENLNLIVTSTHIFVRGSRYCYAFDRSGGFMGQIGRVGQGPGEYSHITDFFVDEKNRSLYLNTYRTLLEYSWDGVFRRSIDLPKNIHGSPVSDVILVRDNLFLGHFGNNRGDLLHNFVLFDQSSKTVKLFDNYVQFNTTRERTNPVNTSMKPYRIGEQIYVKELSNDTLFCLNGQNELVPHVVFDLGEYTVTKELRERIMNERIGPNHPHSEIEQIDVPSTWPVIDTQNHLFFSFNTYNLSGKYTFPEDRFVWTIDMHTPRGIYDAANQTTQLLDSDPITHIAGMINDIDGGLSFWPGYYTSDNELVDIWRAEDMKDYLTDAYFAAHEIKDPGAHQKLKALLQKLDEEDNPVVVIGKVR